MNLNEATAKLREMVGEDCGLGTSLKFDCGSDGVVLIDATQVPNQVTNTDGEAACTIGLTTDTLSGLLEGELEPTTAFMMGKLKVSGDMSVAMRLQQLF